MPTPLVMVLIDLVNADASRFSCADATVPRLGRSRGLLRVALDFRRGRNIWAIEDVLLSARRELHGQVVGLLDGDGKIGDLPTVRSSHICMCPSPRFRNSLLPMWTQTERK